METYSDGKVVGKIKQVFEPEIITFGDGKEKSKLTVVLSIGGDFPKEVIVEFWGQDKIAQEVGQEVEVHFNVKSRVYNGKVYHSLSGRAIRPSAEQADPSEGSAPDSEPDESGNDLPF